MEIKTGINQQSLLEPGYMMQPSHGSLRNDWYG